MSDNISRACLAWLGVAMLVLAGWTSHALAITAVSVDISPSANCTSNASLNVAWTGAGNHFEFGQALDRSGATIGTFGPDASGNNDYTGVYFTPISTAQPAGSLIGSYASVGSNPPTQATAIEYFVVYDCSAHTVIYRCAAAYGVCARTVTAALAAVNGIGIPASSREMLAVLIVLLSLLAAFALRRRALRVR
jgi:hypothetical protein